MVAAAAVGQESEANVVDAIANAPPTTHYEYAASTATSRRSVTDDADDYEMPEVFGFLGAGTTQSSDSAAADYLILKTETESKAVANIGTVENDTDGFYLTPTAETDFGFVPSAGV